MKQTKHRAIPEAIAILQKQLSEFRGTHPPRTRLPDSLWQAAVELAREYGVYAVAHPLRLDYVGLKQRLGRATPKGRRQRTPRTQAATFVEWAAPVMSSRGDTCVIEFESARGGKLRIQWPAQVPPDWPSLLRAWREAEG
jgi:hypothetical protein